MKRLGLSLGVVLLLVACGGGDSGNGGGDVSEDAASATTVSSPDEKATLTLSAGSLPDGVTASDLQIDWAEGNSDEPGAPVVVVRLAPDGLALNTEASLRIELPDSVGDAFVIAHVSNAGFSLIGGDIEEVNGVRFLTTSVDHFSWISLSNVDNLTDVTAAVNPDTVSVGQTHIVDWEVWFQQDEIRIWIPVDDYTKSQLYVFNNVKPKGVQESEGHVRWTANGVSFSDGIAVDPDGQWAPAQASSKAEVDVNEAVDGGVLSYAASSTCKAVNSFDPRFSSLIDISMELHSKGSVEDAGLVEFARAVQQGMPEGASGLMTVEGDDVPFSAAEGDAVDGEISVGGTVNSECTVVSTATTSTPSTLPPIEEPGEDPPDDQADGSTSQPVEDSQRVDGAEIISTRVLPGEPVPHCFETKVLGDGQQATDDALNFLIDHEIDGHDNLEWRIFVEFFQGEVRTSRVYIGPNEPGRDRLDGAIVTAEWVSRDTNNVCVDGGDTSLSVETYTVKIDAFIDGGHVYDEAEGAGPP